MKRFGGIISYMSHMNGITGKILAALAGMVVTGIFLFASLMLQRFEFHERKLDWLDDRLRKIEIMSSRLEDIDRRVSEIATEIKAMRSIMVNGKEEKKKE